MDLRLSNLADIYRRDASDVLSPSYQVSEIRGDTEIAAQSEREREAGFAFNRAPPLTRAGTSIQNRLLIVQFSLSTLRGARMNGDGETRRRRQRRKVRTLYSRPRNSCFSYASMFPHFINRGVEKERKDERKVDRGERWKEKERDARRARPCHTRTLRASLAKSSQRASRSVISVDLHYARIK